VHLKDLGADPAAKEVRTAHDRVREHIAWWQLDGRPYFDGKTVQLRRHIDLDGAQELQKLATTMSPKQLAHHIAGRHMERRKQGRGPVAGVVVRAPLSDTRGVRTSSTGPGR